MRHKLLIDIGNTISKVGVFEDKKQIFIDYFLNLTSENIQEILQKYPNISAALLCTVAKQDSSIEEMLKKLNTFISWNTWLENLKWPVTLMYKNPKTLGRDRIAVASAIRTLYPKENVLCIVLGSCITYNLIESNGCFRAGAIAPGLQMRSRAMSVFTDALPVINFEILKKEEEIYSTETALYSGCIRGIKYELEGYIDWYQQRYDFLRVVLTGGDLKYFEFSLKNKIFAIPNLVLVGLNEILDLNEF
ncbi:MAG: type III pantothenate kinase [Bacteroidales bacterium]